MSAFPTLNDVGEVIAERTLTLQEPGKRRKKILVRLGKPQVFPKGNPDYFCPFQILGLGDDEVRCVAGVDAFQAIQLVLIGIAGSLHFVYRKKFGNGLYWFEKGDNMGFPRPLEGDAEGTAPAIKSKPRRRSRRR